MGKSVLILGEAGSGKTSSLRTVNPKEVIIFSALGKGLPFRGSKKNYTIWDKEKNPKGNVINSSSSKAIAAWLKHISDKMPHIKMAVIDDSTFLAAKELDRRREEQGYFKFGDIAHEFLVLSEIANTLRDDLNVYFLHHIQVEGDGIIESKTIKAQSSGKMISDKLASIEAQYEIVFLACKVNENDEIKYYFKTRDAYSTVKTPIGMFKEAFIDNDLQYVNDTINAYYNEEDQEVIVKEKIVKEKI